MFMTLLAATTLLGGAAYAADIPDADYRLALDTYNIQIQDYQFPSGLRVMFQSERSQPIVAITSVIDRGSEFDQQGHDGIAHVVEHLAFRARHGDLPKNMDVIKQLGGSFNASTSVDWTNYMTVAPIDSMVPLLTLEAKRLKDGVANVTESDVRAEVEIARNELRMRYENAAVGAAWDAIGGQLYPPDHPYSRSTIGDHETLSNIDLAHVQEFVTDNYRPEYTTIVVVGDFELERSQDILLAAFGDDLDLLMSPEDAAAYNALTSAEGEQEFLQKWFTGTLPEHMSKMMSEPPKPRVDCSARETPPPPQSQVTKTVSGMVDRDTVVLAWSLPGGYCEDEMNLRVMGGALGSYIFDAVNPDFDWANDPFPGNDIGCFVGTDEYFSTMYCFIDTKVSDFNAERTIEKAQDGLYRQWEVSQPELQQFQQKAFSDARNSFMADLLTSVDLVSSIGGGRATNAAMFTHFTGDPAYFTANMNAVMQLDPAVIRDLAQKYITRDRMVSVIVEPMDEEERARREAAAGGAESLNEGYAAETQEEAFNLLFDPDSLTAEAITNTTITPDLEDTRQFTLDNGLRVAIMPYGEAPLIRVGLQVKGTDNVSDPEGLNGLAEALSRYNYGSRENLLAVAGGIGKPNQNTIIGEGSSGNLDAVLNKMRWYVEDIDWVMADKRGKISSWQSAAKRDGKYPETWAERLQMEALFPGHPLGSWWAPQEYEVMKDWSRSDLEAWLYRKWQPGNAELIIVGKIDDIDAAEAHVRTYFDGWSVRDGIDTTPIPDMVAPTSRPERKVLIFDKPIATQSAITLMCQASWGGDEENAQIQVVGDVLSEMVWRDLRERSGVTYGAYAYPVYYPGGTSYIAMASLVQNSATGYAVKTMLGLVDKAAQGDIDPGALATAKWSRARSYGLGQQSGQQMLSRLLAVDAGNFDYFDMYKETLGNVSAEAFPQVLEPCAGREVITVVGPVEYATEQLDAEGIAYEVVDWEALYEAQLTKKELKKYKKAKAKEEAEEAKKKAAEDAAG